MSQFDGIDLAVGVVTGARSFEVDQLGRLTGVNYKQVWRPGENTAECRKQENYSWGGFLPSHFTLRLDSALAAGGLTTTLPTDKKRRKKPPVSHVEMVPAEPAPHTMGSCACGFYAYYDGSNDYHAKGRISAVVEGYGETLIGTRGFRASKARIIALRIPKSVPIRLQTLVARNYPDVPLFAKFSEMVEAFPPDGGGAELRPDTDPEFWERTV